MASFERRGDKWRASICKRGVRLSATFRTKLAAQSWASKQETEIEDKALGIIPNKTFSDVLDRYLTEVSAKKRGHAKESLRIAFLKRSRIAKIALRAFGKAHVSDHLTERSRGVSEHTGRLVSSGSVKRELNLISHICTMAVDWGWLKSNPCAEIRQKPKEGKARTRVISDAEWTLMVSAPQTEHEKRVIKAAEFALETGMRSGEICNLTANEVDLGRGVAIVLDAPGAKTGFREVPLSTKAREILASLMEVKGPIFGLQSGTRDGLWRVMRDRAGIKDLHFHDLRRSAISRLAEKLDPFELAKMVGHKDLKMTLNTYYKKPAEETAKKLLNPTPQQPNIGNPVSQESQRQTVVPLLRIVKAG